MLDPDYELFDQIVAAGSLSAAARAAGSSPAMVSKRLARLEARLGAQLIRRSTRHMELTTIGVRFHQDISALITAANAAEARIVGRLGEPAGVLRIAAPTSFGRLYVAPVLARFLTRYSRVEAELDLSDDYVDLLRARMDVAIRITNSPGPGLAAERLADSRRVLCAAPSYVQLHGNPKSVPDLRRHQLLAARGQMPWRLVRGNRAVTVAGESSVATNSSEAVRELTLGGSGIALRSLWDVGTDLARGRLIRVLPDLEGSTDAGIFALRSPSPHVLASAQAFISEMANALRPVPPWER